MFNFENTCTAETGLSDFQKRIVTVLNEKHKRIPPKIKHCRNYKKFDYAIFKNNYCKKRKKNNFIELEFATIS